MHPLRIQPHWQRLSYTRHSDLFGRRYTIELSIDPPFPMVPHTRWFPPVCWRDYARPKPSCVALVCLFR